VDEQVIPLTNVLVRRRTEFGWHCEREGMPLFLAIGQVAPGVSMPVVGTRGTVEVRASVLRDLYLARQR
jgi:hypothetical protein